jgi:secretion/DNA translocation related TadE-like protein
VTGATELTPGTSRRTHGECGTATILAVVLCGAVLVCTSVAVAGGRLLADHRRAAAAADLSALAGAAAVQRGASGCPAAEEVAAANEAVLVGCRVDGEEVQVEVRTDSVRWLGQLARPRAEARAGPVETAR